MNITAAQMKNANARLNRSLVFCFFGLTCNLMNPDNLVLRYIVAVVLFWATFFAAGQVINFLF